MERCGCRGGRALPASGFGAFSCPNWPGRGVFCLENGDFQDPYWCRVGFSPRTEVLPRFVLTSAGWGDKNSGRVGTRDGGPWDLRFGRGPLLREIHIKSNVLPTAKKSGQIYLFFLKLLNSALLQFINQSVNQTAPKWRYFRS